MEYFMRIGHLQTRLNRNEQKDVCDV